jgi:hypothetical protein
MVIPAKAGIQKVLTLLEEGTTGFGRGASFSSAPRAHVMHFLKVFRASYGL